MLTLDESKIRKGRPVGLPYIGSKKRISKKIVQLIIQNFGKDKTVYDIFGGGGAITAECIINGLDVRYNDLDKTVVDMLEVVTKTDREFLKTLMIGRKEFFEIMGRQEKTAEDNLKLLVNSFANNRKRYLYNKEIADFKYKLSKDIVDNHNVFNGYKQTSTFKSYIDTHKEHSRYLGRMQQIVCLQQLELIQELKIFDMHQPTTFDYKYFSNVKGAIIYLDPPYEATESFYQENEMNYEDFYDWVVMMSCHNVVLLSSYNVDDSRFRVVYSFDKVKGKASGGGGKGDNEKLFMVKDNQFENNNLLD